jgi:hypothetical protein
MSSNVYSRITKLLAIQEGRGASEAEAALAAEHVQRLLQEHNLTLSELEGCDEGTGERREKRETGLKAMYRYQQTLLEEVADNFFCLQRVRKVWVPGDKRQKTVMRRNLVTGELEPHRLVHQVVLIGRTVNVSVCTQTYQYLVEAIHRAAREGGYDHRTREGKWFLEGAASRVADRLRDRHREAELESSTKVQQPSGNGTHRELVLSSVYGSEADLNNDVLCSFPPGTTAARRREDEARRARQQAERDRLVAEGVDDTEAWYRAYGYPSARAAELAEGYRRRSARQGRGRTRNWTQGDATHYAKVNSDAYREGKVAGDQIGLDTQVGKSSLNLIGKK